MNPARNPLGAKAPLGMPEKIHFGEIIMRRSGEHIREAIKEYYRSSRDNLLIIGWSQHHGPLARAVFQDQ